MKFEVLVDVIQNTHQHFQAQVNKAINISLTLRNWLIGFYIVEFEQNGEDKAKYGEKLLTNLATKTTHIKGLDERTFRNFRLFYTQYPQIKPLIANHIQQIPIRRLLTTELNNNEKSIEELNIRRLLTTESTSNDMLVWITNCLYLNTC